MRGATKKPQKLRTRAQISIHTPHAGSDLYPMQSIPPKATHFNPHSPCGERLHHKQNHAPYFAFQSTLPMRGATWCKSKGFQRKMHFNPHSPCGERRYASANPADKMHFNPHSPCGERRHTLTALSRSGGISIHTPHAGSDGKIAPRKAD